ncbi:unnamed protein product [Rotaria magnacalcarata]|uniref:Aspergillus nuclease S(1) n=2 Tax=Rotaria magnacalcarata TaxID=392030 RepID=A0A816LAW3_9BILA|nr:unnamed protein product [Rotaria magnacalcarata]CAF1933483.1 unnamed protein product [Rotaria magnacalcarata]CAF2149660.1 unnamed protein product [Rotaria magnacalcarata]CAF3892439.1 unnamed protein product [Rotaria magnacalcarata]CAF3947336.1 unnamed protein product [Rotaria magnacalcarata]
MSSLLLFLIIYSITPHVAGWGRVGHSLVAHLAESQLNERTLKWVKTRLTNQMSEIAFWADSIHFNTENLFGFNAWAWSKPLHYINTPPWDCNYIYKRDCINDRCIHGALKNYSTRLTTFDNSVHHQEDFFFLVHFVGDIHQPLHVGFNNDAGGNGVSVRFMNSTATTNLHSLWDTGMLTHRMRTEFAGNINTYYKYLHSKMLSETSKINDDNFTQWASESLDIVCKQIYFNEMNVTMNSSIRYNLGEWYYQRSWPVVEKRLIQAGARLGALLNRILIKHTESTRPQASTTQQGCYNAAFSIKFSILNFLFVFLVLSYSLDTKTVI